MGSSRGRKDDKWDDGAAVFADDDLCGVNTASIYVVCVSQAAGDGEIGVPRKARAADPGERQGGSLVDSSGIS